METLRYLFAGALILFGLYIVGTNYLRQFRNFRNRNKEGHSSPAPIIGPLFIVVGYGALPLTFSNWIFLAFVLDPDTVITVSGFPT